MTDFPPTTEVKCSCGAYLGESLAPLVVVDRLAMGADVEVSPPRDVRVCKACRHKIVCVPRSDIDRRREDRVA